MNKYYATSYGGYELYHHGIAGMKWGIRRYQNEDGSLTDAGRARYAKLEGKIQKQQSKIDKWQKKIDKRSKKNYKAEKLEYKSAKIRNRAYNGLVLGGNKKRQEMLFKADRLAAKAQSLKAPSMKYTAKIRKAQSLINKYSRKIAKIDPKSTYAGAQFINGQYQKTKLSEINSLSHSDFLMHSGILGMKWGIRRFQNKDGTYTKEGLARRREQSSSADNHIVKTSGNNDLHYGSKPRLEHLEKAGFKIDDDMSGDSYTKQHGNTKISISSYSLTNGDGGLTSAEQKKALEYAKKIEDNFQEYNKLAKNAVLDGLKDNFLENDEDKKSFTKNSKLQVVSLTDHGDAEFWYWNDNNYDGLAGHAAIVEMDVGKKKPLRVSLMG